MKNRDNEIEAMRRSMDDQMEGYVYSLLDLGQERHPQVMQDMVLLRGAMDCVDRLLQEHTAAAPSVYETRGITQV